MKKTFTRSLIAATLALSFTLTSCIGSFPLFNKLRTWNEGIGAKGVNELVFLALLIVPVYEVAGLADLLVLNSIEFWTGDNPVARGTKKITTPDGTYLVKCDAKGYDIIMENGKTTRLDFCIDDKSWSVVNPATGESRLLFAYNPDGTLSIPQSLDATPLIVPQTLLAAR